MTGQRVGYRRVSTLDQNTARQLDGVALDRVFEDKVSGKDTNRPGLQELLKHIREGDTVVCHSFCRLGRNLFDLQSLIKQMTSKGVRVEFVKENLIFTGDDSPMANLLLALLGGVAEFERNLIRERQREGIALARKNGRYKGRKKALNSEQVIMLRARISEGIKKAAVAREFGISRETLYAYLRQESKNQVSA